MISNTYKDEQWNTALYIRLSQDDKDNNISNSVINQEKLLREYVDSRRDDKLNIVECYIDDGYTGTNFERPAFKQMMQDMKSGLLNCIIVKDLSRFGREHIDVDNYLERIFPLMGVRFISVMQHIDSYKNPEKMNSIEIPFLNLINEEYARDISRKTKASLETKRREGKYVYSRAPYGYIKDTKDKYHLLIDVRRAENVREVFKLFLQGESIQSIILFMRRKTLEANENWNREKVKKILQNRIYTGDMVQGITSKHNHKTKKRFTLPEKDWIIVPNTHEAIVGKEIFKSAQIQLQMKTSSKSESSVPSILSRYLTCADCGEKMVRTSTTINGVTYKRFVCSTYKKLGKEACQSHIINEEILTEIILATIQNQIKCIVDIEKVLKISSENTIIQRKIQYHINQIAYLEKELVKFKKIKQGLYQDYKEGILDINEYEEMKLSYNSLINEKENEILEQKQNIEKSKREKHLENNYINNFKRYRNITELTREVLLCLVEGIVVYTNKQIKIIFKFQDEYKKIMSIVDPK